MAVSVAFSDTDMGIRIGIGTVLVLIQIKVGQFCLPLKINSHY